MVAPGCFSSMPRPRWRWWWSPTGRCPSRRPGRPGRRRRRRPGRRRRRPRAPGPAGRAGSRAGWGRPGGWGRCRRAPGTGPRGRRAAGEDRRHDQPAHAVGGVGHHLERRSGAVDERAHVLGEVVEEVTCGAGPGVPRTGWAASTVAPDVGQAGVLAHRPGPGQAQLDAVVLGRVVRGGEHRARGVEPAGGEVQQVGRAQPEVDHVEALGRTPSANAADQLRPRRPHVPAQHDAVGPVLVAGGEAGEGPADGRASSASSWSGTMPRMS